METPEHVIEAEPGKHQCLHCGGSVSADGYAEGAGFSEEEPEEKSEPPPDLEIERLFSKAVGERVPGDT